MTLGGLALAVGILVDDATVEIENTHRNLAMGKPLVHAVLDGASQIAVPTFVSTLAICIVFVPVLLLTGTAQYLFTPLAMAVVFAMMASYLLSRTLVPTMVHHLLRSEVAVYHSGGHGGTGMLWSLHRGVNGLFERLRYRYMGLLNLSLAQRAPVLIGFMAVSIGSLLLVPMVGRDFFPDVDAGTLRLHARTPPGTRIEETELRFADVEQEIRDALPADELDTILDNIGIPNAWGSLAQGDVPNIAATDGEILISLNRARHGPVREREVQLRKRLAEKFPDMVFFFEPANITNQILNFGLPAPIDVQVVGNNAAANYTIAQRLRRQVAAVPGAADVHIHQVYEQPQLNLSVDRVKAGQMGLTQRDVTSSMLISLSGNNQVAPSFWLNPANGISYNVGVQTSQYRLDSLDQLLRTPVTAATNAVTETTAGSLAGAAGAPSIGSSPSGASLAYGNPGAMTGGSAQLLSNLVDVRRSYGPVIINHYNVAPVFDIYSNVDRRDLGSVGAEVEQDRAEGTSEPAARHDADDSGRVRNDEDVFSPPRAGHHLRRRARVPAHGRELPVVARPVHHPHGPAGRHGRDPVDAVRHGYDAERAVAGGVDHVDWRRDGQQHPAGDVRQRRACVDPACAGGDALGRLRPHPARADDGRRDGPGHAADGARARRRRRAERAPRPRRHRRTAWCDGDDAVRRPDHLFVFATETARKPGKASRAGRGSRGGRQAPA